MLLVKLSTPCVLFRTHPRLPQSFSESEAVSKTQQGYAVAISMMKALDRCIPGGWGYHQIIHFCLGFSFLSHPFLGSPIYGNPPYIYIYNYMYIYIYIQIIDIDIIYHMY